MVPWALVHRLWLPTPSGHSGGEAKRTDPPQGSHREAIEALGQGISLEMQESVVKANGSTSKNANKHSPGTSRKEQVCFSISWMADTELAPNTNDRKFKVKSPSFMEGVSRCQGSDGRSKRQELRDTPGLPWPDSCHPSMGVAWGMGAQRLSTDGQDGSFQMWPKHTFLRSLIL